MLCIKISATLSMHLDCGRWLCICVFLFFFFSFFFLFIEKHSIRKKLSVSGSHALCTGPTTSLIVKFPLKLHCSIGPVHCSRDSQIFFFNKTFIKNRFYGTIHIFKNYFAIVFSDFSFQQNMRYPNGP